MAERPHLFERRLPRTIASLTAVGAFALAGCRQDVSDVGYTNPASLVQKSGYIDFGKLHCDSPTPNQLTGQYDYADRAVRALVVNAILRTGQPDSMYVKIFGPDSSVVATHQGAKDVDVDQGTLRAESPVVIEKILPGVRMRVAMHAGGSKLVDATAAVCG